MKAVILLNGEPYRGRMDDSNAYVYCCDGAYDWARDRVRIDENLGDFDSLPYVPIPAPKEIYPSEKDVTDGEIALNRAIERGAGEIVIYGGGGKREDHFLGNLHLLYAAAEKNVKAEMVTNYARVFVGTGEVKIYSCKGKTISLFPFGGNAHIIKGEGLYYPVRDLLLRYGVVRGISNVATDDVVSFTVDKGRALVFVNFKDAGE